MNNARYEEVKKTFQFLPLSLKLKTLGGIATALIPRGTPLPTRRQQTFSTTEDDQKAVDITILLGESPVAKHNTEIGDVRISGIPLSSKGIPEIDVTFKVDKYCNILINASIQGTDIQVNSELESIQPYLTEDNVVNFLKKAELTRAEDQEFLEFNGIKIHAEKVLENAEKEINIKSGSERDRIVEGIASLGLALESGNKEEIVIKTKALEEIAPLYNFVDIFDTFFGKKPTPTIKPKPTDTQLPVPKTNNKSQKEVVRGSQYSEMNSSKPIKNNRNVFVVHGRNLKIRNAMFDFLRSIDLHPLEWSEAVRATGKTSPYIGEILDAAFSNAQAVIVLMTPDDEARLCEQFWDDHDPKHETELTPQARPNVIFEAGIAMGRNPDRTILVEIGKLRPFSDIGGRHVIRFNGSTEKRQELALRLKTAGCLINLDGTDWHRQGVFDLT